mmetsp:Transcript_19383/g.65690  ORF Transcript_19383/g.65690 Transcript_19383/m.65690 type:complete len:426 (-) Transcript_19383:69-1346(-)
MGPSAIAALLLGALASGAGAVRIHVEAPTLEEALNGPAARYHKKLQDHNSDHLVLAYMRGYHPQMRRNMIAKYVGSLRQAGSNAAVAIMVDAGICPELEDKYQHVCFRYDTLNIHNNAKAMSMHNAATASRFLYWVEVMKIHEAKFTKALATDMRDAFFQADPFIMPTFGGLVASTEYTMLLLGDCLWHTQRCQLCTMEGYDMKDACIGMGQYPISNVGVMYGTLQAMERTMELYSEALMNNKGPRCWDQALWNAFLYRGDLRKHVNVTLATSEYSPFSSVCDGPTMQLVEQEGGKRFLSSIHGNVFALVHQYDRIPYLASWFLPRLLNNHQISRPEPNLNVSKKLIPLDREHLHFKRKYMAKPHRVKKHTTYCQSPFRLSSPRPDLPCKPDMRAPEMHGNPQPLDAYLWRREEVPYFHIGMKAR